MIRWLHRNRHKSIPATRWVIVGCGTALLGIADLSRTPAHRAIAIMVVAGVAAVFTTWLILALMLLARPRISLSAPYGMVTAWNEPLLQPDNRQNSELGYQAIDEVPDNDGERMKPTDKSIDAGGTPGPPTSRTAQPREQAMTINLYSFLDLYDRALVSASHLLDKGLDHAVAQGVSERDMLDWRLIGDMHPLGFQVMVVVNFSCQWPARVAGLAVPAPITADLDVRQFQEAIAQARDYLAALTPAQFEGRDDIPLTVRITDALEPTLPSGQWLAVFATTNIHFHLSTLYGILRANGVAIGKIDLFAGRL